MIMHEYMCTAIREMGGRGLNGSPYEKAQNAMAQLRVAVHELLEQASAEGMSNAAIGRALGIYMGHKGHQGHVSRTILALMEIEGVVIQDSESRRWLLVRGRRDDPQGG